MIIPNSNKYYMKKDTADACNSYPRLKKEQDEIGRALKKGTLDWGGRADHAELEKFQVS